MLICAGYQPLLSVSALLQVSLTVILDTVDVSLTSLSVVNIRLSVAIRRMQAGIDILTEGVGSASKNCTVVSAG